MNKFEVVLILNPELSTSKLNSEIDNFKSKLISQSGSVVNQENWGIRDLSYSIKKLKKAYYIFMQLEASGSIIKDLNNDLNQSENLIRYLFIKVDKHQELPTKLNYEKK
tara:strand:- start:302 stop:628 length:327 start_codon:yes stop_codon:yes gene_type:complete